MDHLYVAKSTTDFPPSFSLSLIRTHSGPLVKLSWKNHIVHVGDPITRFPLLASYMLGDPITRFPSLTVTRFPHSNHIIHLGGPSNNVPTLHIRYGGTIRGADSYKVPLFISGKGGTSVIDSYQGLAYHIRYGRTIRVIDSYKVSVMDSNHEDTLH